MRQPVEDEGGPTCDVPKKRPLRGNDCRPRHGAPCGTRPSLPTRPSRDPVRGRVYRVCWMWCIDVLVHVQSGRWVFWTQPYDATSLDDTKASVFSHSLVFPAMHGQAYCTISLSTGEVHTYGHPDHDLPGVVASAVPPTLWRSVGPRPLLGPGECLTAQRVTATVPPSETNTDDVDMDDDCDTHAPSSPRSGSSSPPPQSSPASSGRARPPGRPLVSPPRKRPRSATDC